MSRSKHKHKQERKRRHQRQIEEGKRLPKKKYPKEKLKYRFKQTVYLSSLNPDDVKRVLELVKKLKFDV